MPCLRRDATKKLTTVLSRTLLLQFLNLKPTKAYTPKQDHNEPTVSTLIRFFHTQMLQVYKFS